MYVNILKHHVALLSPCAFAHNTHIIEQLLALFWGSCNQTSPGDISLSSSTAMLWMVSRQEPASQCSLVRNILGPVTDQNNRY